MQQALANQGELLAQLVSKLDAPRASPAPVGLPLDAKAPSPLVLQAVAASAGPPPLLGGGSMPGVVSSVSPLLNPPPAAARAPAEFAALPGTTPPTVKQGNDLISSLLQMQHALLSKLSAAPREGVGAIGHILSGGEDDASGLKLPGAKGAAAREAFREEVKKNPTGIAESVQNNLQQVLVAQPLIASAPQMVSMRAYYTQVTPFGNSKTLAHVAFAVATLFDLLSSGREQDIQHALGLTALLCAAIDQVAIDGGSWVVASQLLCLPEPPWSHIQRKSDATHPFTPLADARWIAAILGYLKDVEAVKSHRKQWGKTGEQDSDEGKRRPRPRAKALLQLEAHRKPSEYGFSA
eukprot:4011649-Amphidinium_carterae.1